MQLPTTMQETAECIFRAIANEMHVKLDGMTIAALHRLANGSDEDAIIFDNAGGQPFSVWTGQNARAMVNHAPDYIHVQCIGGVMKVNMFPSLVVAGLKG